MSHIDEGELHAYLDGALDEYPAGDAVRIREHLDSCAECAERLELERAIRMEAHAILGLAAPEVELPSFEELRAYVERTRPKGRAISVYAYRMRLAASVVLALGTGWMLRGGLPGAQAPEAQAVTQVDATEAVAQGARALSEPVSVASGGGASGDIGSIEGAGVSEMPATVQALAVRADLPGEVVAERQEIGSAPATGAEIRSLPEAEMRSAAEAELFAAAEPVPVEAQKQRAAAGADLTASGAAAEGGADLAAEAIPADDSPEEDAPLDFARFADEVATTASIDETVTTAAIDAAPAAPVEPTADSAKRQEASPSRERSAGAPVTSALEQNSFAARRSVSDDEVAISDEPSMAVPGLEVVAVTSLGQGTAPSGTHVVQRMEDGSIIEIYHLLPDVSLDVVPAAASGLNEVKALTEGGWIVLQGPHPAEELETLLESLFPAG
jgi:hypothetical protein